MVKLIESSQFADVPEIGAKFAEFNSPAMKKEAETIFGRSYESLRPTDDKYVGIHLVALGDEEHYGQNRNNDAFPKAACVRYHDTFVKHGHVFAHHHNDAKKDPILGSIKASAYNEKMGRIELFIWADKEKASEGLGQLEKEGEASFSMACFRAGTLVTTINGCKPIESVVVGDVVLTHTGSWKHVKRTMTRKADGYYRIKAESRRSNAVLEVTAEHPFLSTSYSAIPFKRRKDSKSVASIEVCRKNRRNLDRLLKWVPVKELAVRDFIVTPAPSSDVPGVTPIADVNEARLLGYYLAEGSVTQGKVEFTCNIHDAAVKEIPTLRRWSSVKFAAKPNSDKAVAVCCYGGSPERYFTRLVGRRCENKVIPSAIFAAGNEVKLNFIAAWFNGDGWQDKDGLHISTSNPGLADQLTMLLTSLGIESSSHYILHPAGRGLGLPANNDHVVNISNYYSGLFAEISKAAAIEVARKQSHAFIAGRYLMNAVKAIEYVDEPVQVYNLSVEDDESYVANGFAAHNCSVPGDRCSICGAFRKNASDPNMCDHIRNQLGKIAENGKTAYMINDNPTWFDISFVTRPADRIAYSLKVADEQSDGIATSEALAKAAGIVEPPWLEPGLVADKRAVLRKLADAYEDHVREPLAYGMFGPVAKEAESRLDDATIETLRKMPVKEAMAFLLDSGTFLGPRAFCRYAMGPKSAEFAEVGPHADEVGRLAAQAIKEAAWLDRFDFAQAGDFDVDRFTTRPSTRFTEVARAGFAVKSASFGEDNILDLVAASDQVEKTAGDRVDANRGFCFNTVDKPILAVALKYAEYKVAALNAALSGTFGGGASNTRNGEALLALVAAQDL